jgi:flavin reductase (DIM6/NTAB) family NADH-FMN oxidoreductase RutF
VEDGRIDIRGLPVGLTAVPPACCGDAATVSSGRSVKPLFKKEKASGTRIALDASRQWFRLPSGPAAIAAVVRRYPEPPFRSERQDAQPMNVAFPQLVRHPAADGHALKQAMRTLAGGVSVITAGIGEARTGATVTSATALSVEPPTMIVTINLSSSTWPAIRRHGHFCVNILGRHHQDVADRFAGKGGVKGADRYAEADWREHSTGALGLVGALAVIDCELEEAIKRHSHAIILGRVAAITLGVGASLVYANGRYGSFSD